jgi:hypothetical protein
MRASGQSNPNLTAPELMAWISHTRPMCWLTACTSRQARCIVVDVADQLLECVYAHGEALCQVSLAQAVSQCVRCGRMSSEGKTQDYLPQRTSVKESEGASRVRPIVVLAFDGAVFSGCDTLRPAENRDPFNPALEII